MKNNYEHHTINILINSTFTGNLESFDNLKLRKVFRIQKYYAG